MIQLNTAFTDWSLISAGPPRTAPSLMPFCAAYFMAASVLPFAASSSGPFSLVELVVETKPVRPVEQVHLLFVVRSRDSLLRTAELTFADGASIQDLQLTATHFAFEYV